MSVVSISNSNLESIIHFLPLLTICCRADHDAICHNKIRSEQHFGLRLQALAPGVDSPFVYSNGALAGEPRVYRDKVAPHWFANRTRFWYRNELPNGGREFILVDAQQGTRQPAFDHARVAEAFGKLLGRSVTADQLPVERLAFQDGAGAVVLRGSDKAWRLDLSGYEFARPTRRGRLPSRCPRSAIAPDEPHRA